MRTASIAVLVVVGGLAVAAWQPNAASACSGRYLEFADALPLSNGAIYAGRVTRATVADSFWIDMTIDVERVIRGPAASRIPRAQSGFVCDGIVTGQYGYVVRGVLDPLEPPAPKRLDLFFRISNSEADAALRAAGMPDTSTAPDAETQTPPSVPWAWLALWFATAFVMAARVLRGPQRDDPIR